MARLFAKSAINTNQIDLNQLDRFGTDFTFMNNVFFKFRGITYEDVYLADWSTGGTSYSTSFGGKGMAATKSGAVTKGTVTGILEEEAVGNKQVTNWGIEKISLSAVAVYKATQTSGRADDMALVRKALSGNDQMNLSKQADVAHGYKGNDSINGNAGNDRLYGDAGRDKLKGAAGADLLDGGLGRDLMAAGVDNKRDVFMFRDVMDSQVGGKKRDKISQFDSGEDKINLKAIDADTDAGGNQAFAFSGTTAAANSVWTKKVGSSTVVRGDVDGDKVADFEIELLNVASLAASDIIL